MKFDIVREIPHLDIINKTIYGNRLEVGKIIEGVLDNNWIKEYDHFYSKQPKATPYSKRIFLKDKKKIKGFCHIRPISDDSRLSETYLSPPDYMTPRNGYYLKCLHDYKEYEHRIKCVPFIMPETVFGMCIHASIWICLKILQQISDGYVEALDIPKIQTLAMGHPFTDRQGLPFNKTARMLRMCSTNAFYITNRKLSDDQILTTLYAYVESGLPVIIGVNTKNLPWWNVRGSGYHSIVAIGHTMKNNAVDGFIFHDESVAPYQVLSKDELLKAWYMPKSGSKVIREAVVAVPPIVNVPFENANSAADTLIKWFVDNKIIELKDSDFRTRPILFSPSELFFDKSIPEIIRMLFLSPLISPPPFLWIIQKHGENTDSKLFFYWNATIDSKFFLLYYKYNKEESIFFIKDNKLHKASKKGNKLKIEEIK